MWFMECVYVIHVVYGMCYVIHVVYGMCYVIHVVYGMCLCNTCGLWNVIYNLISKQSCVLHNANSDIAR